MCARDACPCACYCFGQVSDEAFVSTPSFLSFAPVFLKLCGQAADEHPPQRPEAFEVREAQTERKLETRCQCCNVAPA